MQKLKSIIIPLLLAASTALAADIKITWTDPNPAEMGVLKYRVYRDVGTNAWIRLGETANKFYNLSVTNGTYRFRVTGVNQWGEGTYTNLSEVAKSVSIPAPIINVGVTNWVR
jgi:hypothetical protein